MSNFKIYYLGVGSATPSKLHQPSCQVVDFRGRLFVIDRGEGAQLSMRKMHIKFSRIEHILISHLHGDHFFGLPGLLSTLALHDIGGALTVHIPRQGVEWLRQTMDLFCRQRSFDLRIEPIDPEGGLLIDEGQLKVTAFPLTHRVPCTGFKFECAPGLRRLRKDMLEWLDIPVSRRHAIKEGADFTTDDGRFFENSRLTEPGTPPSSYAYCSDTAFNLDNARYVAPVDTLYHEATYLADNEAKAADRFHSTAAQAVRFAVEAKARRLVIGHYSKSYPDTEGHLREAVEEAARLGADIEIIAANEGLVLDA